MNKNVKVSNPMKVITGPDTRWSYANVWEPKSINGGTPKYSVCHLPGHNFQTLLFSLHLELRHRQMFLGAATLSTLQVRVASGAHLLKEIILQDAVRLSQHRLALCCS